MEMTSFAPEESFFRGVGGGGLCQFTRSIASVKHGLRTADYYGLSIVYGLRYKTQTVD